MSVTALALGTGSSRTTSNAVPNWFTCTADSCPVSLDLVCSRELQGRDTRIQDDIVNAACYFVLAFAREYRIDS